MNPNGLQYVQYLSLTFNECNTRHDDHLSQCIPNMTSLKEVTLNLDAPVVPDQGLNQSFVDTDDFANVISLLKHCTKTLTVHTYLRLFFHKKRDLFTYFHRFENEWRHWRSLNIETLIIDIGQSQNVPALLRILPRNTFT